MKQTVRRVSECRALLRRASALSRSLEPGAPATAWTPSSLGRELRFLASHAVHYLALIELMLTAQGAADRERP